MLDCADSRGVAQSGRGLRSVWIIGSDRKESVQQWEKTQYWDWEDVCQEPSSQGNQTRSVQKIQIRFHPFSTAGNWVFQNYSFSMLLPHIHAHYPAI